MKKLTLLVAGLLLLPAFAFAQTPTENIQSQIIQLLSQRIQVLETQLAIAQKVQPAVTCTPVVATPATPSLSQQITNLNTLIGNENTQLTSLTTTLNQRKADGACTPIIVVNNSKTPSCDTIYAQIQSLAQSLQYNLSQLTALKTQAAVAGN